MRGFEVKSNEYSVMNRVMLRFRPIAPKPTVDDSPYVVAGQERRSDLFVKTVRRTKRKYVRARGRQNKQQCARRKITDGVLPGKKHVESREKVKVTLQLLPERSEDDKSFDNSSTEVENISVLMMNWRNIDQYRLDDKTSESGLTAGFKSVTETWIIVECVTDTYTETGVGLGFSDREKINKLELDTCPGFVTDSTNNVVWANDACRKMIEYGEEQGKTMEGKDGLKVKLVVKEKLQLPYNWPSFACRVSVIQQRGEGHKWSRTVPCDVWRLMEFPGFAWKLDLLTSLGLGTGL